MSGVWRQEVGDRRGQAARKPENKPLPPRGSLTGRLVWEERGWRGPEGEEPALLTQALLPSAAPQSTNGSPLSALFALCPFQKPSPIGFPSDCGGIGWELDTLWWKLPPTLSPFSGGKERGKGGAGGGGPAEEEGHLGGTGKEGGAQKRPGTAPRSLKNLNSLGGEGGSQEKNTLILFILPLPGRHEEL